MPATRTLLANVTPRGRLVLAACALGTVVVMFLLFQLASAPSYSTLLTGLDPAQTGKITAALDQKGIGYQLQNNGTALAVDSGKTAQARIALASAGLPGSSQPGFSLFDKQKLGASSFQQQVTYQRALEGQLAQTIQQIQGVSGAQVQLVLPDPSTQLFSDHATPATAAVLLSGTSSLDPGAVRGIAQLVASSVQGLRPANVTITDGTGQLLWPGADAAAGAGGPLLAKQAAEARYDQQMSAGLGAMLSQALGPGKAQVQVHASLDADRSTLEKLQYARKGVPLTQHSEVETLTGKGGAGAGAAGTATNIPAFAQTAGGGNSKYNHRITDTTLGVDKTVTRTDVAPGAVTGQSVSVLLDTSVPAAAAAPGSSLYKALAAAAGINTGRGDVLAVSRVKFAVPATAPAAGPLGGGMLGYAKYAVAAVGSLLFLFFVTRHLRRRERQPFSGEPTWTHEIAGPRTLSQLAPGAGADSLPAPPLPRSAQSVAREQVESLVAREPERVAAQVRTWLSEER